VVYPFDIMVSIGESDDEFIKSCTKILAKEHVGELKEDEVVCRMSQTQQGRTIMLSGNQTIIRLKSKPQSAREYGFMAHEVFHAVTFIMDRVGMKLKLMTSDEAYAYLVGYVTEEVYKRI